MKQKIVFVAHCILNTCSKVVMFNLEEMQQEEQLRRQFLKFAIDKGIQIVQLPCPEQTLYGSSRWGHTSEQFDNAYFREHCKQILRPILLDLKEYLSYPERFEVMAVIGIDGSPSCGVDYTCTGKWGGNLSGRKDLSKVIQDVSLVKQSGIFIQELKALLDKQNMAVPVIGLFASEPYKIQTLLT